jgi:hypothetical protein
MSSTAKTASPFSRQSNLLWLLVYAIAMISVVTLVLSMRAATLRDLDTPEARAEWQAWREAPPNSDTTGPVRRKPPSATEPPALVLMRDHFAVVMSGSVIFSSLLFAAIMIAARGALSRSANLNAKT